MSFKIQNDLKRGQAGFWHSKKPKISHIQPQTQTGCKETQPWPLLYVYVYGPAPITHGGRGIIKSVNPTVLSHEAFQPSVFENLWKMTAVSLTLGVPPIRAGNHWQPSQACPQQSKSPNINPCNTQCCSNSCRHSAKEAACDFSHPSPSR